MPKNNRRFNWRNIREEEFGFHLETPAPQEETGGSSGKEQQNGDEAGNYQVNQYNRNDAFNNRMQANDELYVAPQEHAGMSLTTDLFDGKNFHTWTRAVKRGLFARNKLCFIDGSMSEPPEDSLDHMQWVRTDYLVFNWISNSIVNEISRGLQGLDSSRRMWEELHKRFGKRNGPRIYKLRRMIATYMQNSQSVMIYFNALCGLWDDLDLLKNSRLCICEASAYAKNEIEEKRMMQFLMGLNEVYEPIRQQILILNPLPTVSQAYGMVLQVEEQLEMNNLNTPVAEQSAMYNAYKPGFKGSDGFKRRLTKEEKARLKCDHCGGIRVPPQNLRF